MSADSEEILHDTVHRCEPLQMSWRLEAAHLTLPLAGRLMRDLWPWRYVRLRRDGSPDRPQLKPSTCEPGSA